MSTPCISGSKLNPSGVWEPLPASTPCGSRIEVPVARAARSIKPHWGWQTDTCLPALGAILWAQKLLLTPRSHSPDPVVPKRVKSGKVASWGQGDGGTGGR